MPTAYPDRTLELLDGAECRRLLNASTVGRLGFTADALPAIVPVPFAVHDELVVVPAHRDSAVVRAMRGAVVAFQVDAYAGESRTGWSVTAVGPSRAVSDPADVAALDAVRDQSWPGGPDRCYLAVTIALLTGWRLSPLPVGDRVPAAADRP